MNNHPHKAEEPTAPYLVKKAVKPVTPSPAADVRYADLEKVRATNAKLIKVHHEVLKKLAQ